MISSVLLVCTANICRSPMAAALLASTTESATVQVESAGVAALSGEGPDPAVQDLLAAKGLDISGHRARQLELTLARNFELILAMEARQVDWIKRAYPQLWGRTYRLGHWLDLDILDPYGGSSQDLQNAKSVIEKSLDQWHQRIQFA
ncbi:MAG: low molecular weight protein-tyrosine-phosphatase [Desulfohalobiaceae bacterium]